MAVNRGWVNVPLRSRAYVMLLTIVVTVCALATPVAEAAGVLRATPRLAIVIAGRSSTPVVVTLRGITPRRGSGTLAFSGLPAGAATTRSPVRYATLLGIGSTAFRIATSAATPLGNHTITVRAPSGESDTVMLRVVAPLIGGPVIPPAAIPVPVVTKIVPSRVTSGTESVILKITGKNFIKAATTLKSLSPFISVNAVRVISSKLIEVTVTIKKGAPTSTALLSLSTFGVLRRINVALAIFKENSQAASFSIKSVAVSYPRPGTNINPAKPIWPKGILATNKSGIVKGSWLLDGVVFDRFTVTVKSGRPTPIVSHVPIPSSYTGEHRLELLVDQPQRLTSSPVSVFQSSKQHVKTGLIEPVDGYVFGMEPISFRWIPIPGAAAYEIEIERQSSLRTLQFRSTDSRWLPNAAERFEIGVGTHRWRIRAIFPGNIRHDPTEWRRLVLLPDKVQLKLLRPEIDEKTARLKVGWAGGGVMGLLYDLELLTNDGKKMIYVAKTNAESHLLPKRIIIPEKIKIRLKAIRPDGREIGFSERNFMLKLSKVPQPDVVSTSALGVRINQIEVDSQLEPPAAEKADDVSSDKKVPQIKVITLQPADNSILTSSRPVIEGRWNGVVDKEDVSLFVDYKDVTALSNIRSNTVSYTPLQGLAPGEHRLELILGDVVSRWKFNISLLGAMDRGKGRATKHQASWNWRLNAEGGITTFAGDKSDHREIEPSRAPMGISGVVDYESDNFSLQSTIDTSWTRQTEQVQQTQQNNTNWVINGDANLNLMSAALSMGHISPSFLDQAEFLTAGQTNGGMETRFTKLLGMKASLFHSFNPQLGVDTSGSPGNQQVFRGAALEIGGDVKPYMLRLVGIDVEEHGVTEPGGEGASYGFIGSYAVAQGWSLNIEGTHGGFKPDANSLEKESDGYAGRLGLQVKGDTHDFEVIFRTIDAGYLNPANGGYTDAGSADTDSVEFSFLKQFDYSNLATALLFQKGGDSLGPETRSSTAVVEFFSQHSENLSYSLMGNLTMSQSNSDEEIFKDEQKNYGIGISAQKTLSEFQISEAVSVQFLKNEIRPIEDTTTIDANLSIGGYLLDSLYINATGNVRRDKANEAFGNTDTISYSIYPEVSFLKGSLVLRPSLSYNRVKNDETKLDTTTEQYQLFMEWSPKWAESRVALNFGAGWSRTQDIPANLDTGFIADYTIGFIFRTDGSGSSREGPWLSIR